MNVPSFPAPDVLLERLVRCLETNLPRDQRHLKHELLPTRVEEPPTEEFLGRLAVQLGMQRYDLFLIVDLAIPDDELLFDERASRALPRLVDRALTLPAIDLRRMREYARSMVEFPQAVHPRAYRSREQYPAGFGSLLVRMLALRNLGWSSAAQVMFLMSGVYLSASTIGAIGRGVRELDPELLNGFAAVLGIPVGVLACLTGLEIPVVPERPEAVVETSALLWDVRHLSGEQVQQVLHLVSSR